MVVCCWGGGKYQNFSSLNDFSKCTKHTRGKFISRDSNIFLSLCNFLLHLKFHQFGNDQLFRFYLNNSDEEERKTFHERNVCADSNYRIYSLPALQHCCVIISSLCFSIRAMFITSKKVSTLFEELSSLS